MRHIFKFCMFFVFAMLFGLGNGAITVSAEGSVDQINQPGHRLHLDGSFAQQFKVYAEAGEFINVGASHLGYNGVITIYNPMGDIVQVYDDASAQSNIAVINNLDEEKKGPIGFGNGGYNPGIVPVTAGNDGIWTVVFASTSTNNGMKTFKNDFDWKRSADQTFSFGIVAWDVTISKNQPANLGGTLVTGRLYTNETGGWIREFGNTTSPKYVILTREGFTYKLEFKDADPLNFRFSTNNVGIMSGMTQTPTMRSVKFEEYQKSNDYNAWKPDSLYLFGPQRQDTGIVVNNKIFFNVPDPSMPASALVTDVFMENMHMTWLYQEPTSLTVNLDGFTINADNGQGASCFGGSIQVGVGGIFNYTADKDGLAELKLDLNNNGSFNDPVDRTIFGRCKPGQNEIVWDGKNGEMADLAIADNFTVPYRLSIRAGEVHVLFWDVENSGGFSLRLLNDIGTADLSSFSYDHTAVGGGVSGGTSGNVESTTELDVYNANFGNNVVLDYYKCYEMSGAKESTITIDIKSDCSTPQIPDSDNDGISDFVDLDDDNDGVPDLWEYCNPSGDWTCLSVQDDPTADNDGDNVPNFMDADDAGYANACVDLDGNGVCDDVLPELDTDLDGIPDHLDLDSDNDGITDLVEAGHGQPDVDGNGVIDGDETFFGANGLYDPIDSDPASMTSTATYARWDTDGDDVPDHDDLDSDNDGIFDVAEAYLGAHDSNRDGFIDDGNGNVPVVSTSGLAPFLDPLYTTKPIALPPDYDGDGIPDWHDLDSDNDGINDVVENNNVDVDNDGRIGTGMATVDVLGRCNDAVCAATSALVDTDNDNIPDWHDWDSDNDGINDVVEAGWVDTDNNGMPTAGIPAVNDLGQVTGANTSDPMDFDNDMVPDWRDLDSDNDGINDVLEASFGDPDNDGILGEGKPTVNDKGQGTGPLASTSMPTNTDGDAQPDFRDLDTDGDGIWDVMEAGHPDPDFDGIIGTGAPAVNPQGQAPGTNSSPTNTDGDGQPDFRDLDSDNDFILDINECPDGTPCVNGDGDMFPDFQDIDRDNDGIDDNFECESNVPCVDTDGDGISDVDDLDSDGDGLPDIAECPGGAPCPDSDNDGIPDFRDFLCTPASGGIPALTNAIGGGIFCETMDVVLSANNTNTNLTGMAEFEWTGPDGFSYSGVQNPAMPFELTLNNIDEAQAGPYALTIKSQQGCESTPVTVEVEVKAKPETPNLAVNDATPCPSSTATLSTVPYSGTAVSYQWSYNGTVVATTTNPVFKIEDFTAANEGDYSVMTIADDCASEFSNVQSLEMTQPGVALTAGNSAATNPACEESKIQFSVPLVVGATYSWVGPNGFSANTHNPIIASADMDDVGEYYAFVQMEGCTFPSTVTNVSVRPKPAAPFAVNNGPICENTTVEFNVAGDTPTGNVVYSWYNNQNVKVGETTTPNFTLSNIQASQGGNYVAKVSVDGCESEKGTASFVQVDEIPEEMAFIPENPVFACQENAVEIMGLQPTVGTGKWQIVSPNIQVVNPNQNFTYASNFTQGENKLIWSLSNGACKDYSKTALTVFWENDIAATNDVFTIDGTNSLVDGDVIGNDDVDMVHQWVIRMLTEANYGTAHMDQNGFDYTPNANYYGPDEVDYEICSANCPDLCATATARTFSNRPDEITPVFVPNVISPNGDDKNDTFIIPELNNYPDNRLCMFNRWGDSLFETEGYRNDWDGTYNGSQLPAGTYYYVLMLDKNDKDSAVTGHVTIVR